MTEHTPGPWRIELPMAPGEITICAGGPVDDGTTVYVAGVSDFRVPHDPDVDDDRSVRSLAQAWADARLIVAAPDLLAAWITYLDAQRTIDDGGWHDNRTDVARARTRQATAIQQARAAVAAVRREVIGGSPEGGPGAGRAV